MSSKARKRSTSAGTNGGSTPQQMLFWKLAAELQRDDARVTEGRILDSRR
jgi:hypothetical protein